MTKVGRETHNLLTVFQKDLLTKIGFGMLSFKMFSICQTQLVQQIILSSLLKTQAKIYLSVIPNSSFRRKTILEIPPFP